MMRVPYVLSRPMLGNDENRQLVQFRRDTRKPFTPGEARIGNRLLGKIAKLWGNHHDAKRPGDVTPRTAENTFDVLFLLRSQRVPAVRSFDAITSQSRHCLA